MSAYGAYDMAGNVKEWVWNTSGDLRYLLGGSWSEPRYVFSRSTAQERFHDPLETAQLPFLEMFGAPENQKRLARLSGGHIPSDPRELQAEIIAWLDGQLGPGS